MSQTRPDQGAKTSKGRSLAATQSGQGNNAQKPSESIDALQTLSRQRWLIAFVTSCGLAMGIAYANCAQIWYQSEAEVLIAQRSAGMTESGTGTDVVEDDVLANHLALLRSRRIISEALNEYGLIQLPSVAEKVGGDTDEIDYVMANLSLAKGGNGSTKGARSLRITLRHTNPEDTQLILTAIMKRYERFIVAQIEDVMGSAGRMITEAKGQLEADLAVAEAEHLASRQNAPLIFQGEGSSNVYLDRYRRLSEELLELDIQESTLRTRLDRVEASLKSINENSTVSDHLDKLALIDSESLERLSLFAGLQTSAANSVEFKVAMPSKMEEARAQVTRLLELNSEQQRLMAVFGPGHLKVREIQKEISLVESFVKQSKEKTTPELTFGSSAISPEELLRAYVGFIHHDIAALGERRKELVVLSQDAENKAKELIEYELKDLVLQKKIARNEEIFAGIVNQLQELNTVSGLSGFLYEFLEVPRLGRRVWPSLSVCGVGGMVLGLLSGLLLAIGNDLRDRRFRTASEIDSALGLISLGHVGQLASIEDGVDGLIAAEDTTESESFRLGRTMLLPDIRARKLRSLGFTSSMQGDGKSTIVANFAQSFAQVGLRVLVVDADLRRPSQHRYLGVAKTVGFAEVLSGELPLAKSIHETKIPSLSIITAGKTPRNPAELLQSQHFDDAIKALTEHYDLVLVDLPPVLAVSDPAVVLPRLDGAVLVVRVARVKREELLNSLRRLQATGANLLGSMLNVVGAANTFDSGGGHYGYYRSEYGKQAGGDKPLKVATKIDSTKHAA